MPPISTTSAAVTPSAPMLFDTPADLARAFEAGEPTLLRWQKTLRHAGSHAFDAAAIIAAILNPAHRAIAEQG